MEKIFWPKHYVDDITHIPVSWLTDNGFKLLFVDVDNTLADHDSPVPNEGVEDWVKAVIESGIEIVLVSNNYQSRVRPFGEMLGLDYIYSSMKPLGRSMRKYAKGKSKSQVALVGDQIFTDVLAAKLKGYVSILVKPKYFDKLKQIRFKRKIEVRITKKLDWDKIRIQEMK